MNKAQKAEQVEEIKKNLENATAVYLVDYRGVNVADVNQLRVDFRKAGVSYKVYKNTLVKRAIDEVGRFERFKDLLTGMNGLIFTDENFVAPAKIIKDYFKSNEKFVLKGCYIEKDFYDGSQLELLASMPTKEEVMAGIVGSVASPATAIVGALNAVVRDIVSLVDEISKKKAA